MQEHDPFPSGCFSTCSLHSAAKPAFGQLLLNNRAPPTPDAPASLSLQALAHELDNVRPASVGALNALCKVCWCMHIQLA